jgi:hypothetical protein
MNRRNIEMIIGVIIAVVILTFTLWPHTQEGRFKMPDIPSAFR